MGQRALGILYGCECPELPGDKEEPGEGKYNLVDHWLEAKKLPRYGGGTRIRVEMEGEKDLIGVWVAVGGSGEDDAPYLVEQAMPLSSIEFEFAEQIDVARKLWKEFAAWAAKSEKVKFGKPTLWLTPCQVA